MAAKKKTEDGPTGTVQARRKTERDRQKAADQLRAMVVEDMKADHAATNKRLKNKPEDTRTIAPVDPNAGVL